MVQLVEYRVCRAGVVGSAPTSGKVSVFHFHLPFIKNMKHITKLNKMAAYVLTPHVG